MKYPELNFFILMMVIVAILFLGTLAINWIACRLTARECPDCGERWFTELTSEWDRTETWHCAHCNNNWLVATRDEK